MYLRYFLKILVREQLLHLRYFLNFLEIEQLFKKIDNFESQIRTPN